MNLELAAMRWLWLEKGCHYVVQERSPRHSMGLPDVLGVTNGRWMIEIEIKRSMSDFMADFRKHHRVNREFRIDRQPRQFYYLMEEPLAAKALPKIPAWAGLMHCRFNGAMPEIVKKAPVNERSERLNIRECVQMARCMVNHMMSEALRNECLESNYRNNDSMRHTDWLGGGGTWEI